MDKQEIENLINQSIHSAIRRHEIRVGLISGIIGIFFVFGIMHSIWLIKNWIF